MYVNTNVENVFVVTFIMSFYKFNKTSRPQRAVQQKFCCTP